MKGIQKQTGEDRDSIKGRSGGRAGVENEGGTDVTFSTHKKPQYTLGSCQIADMTNHATVRLKKTRTHTRHKDNSNTNIRSPPPPKKNQQHPSAPGSEISNLYSCNIYSSCPSELGPKQRRRGDTELQILLLAFCRYYIIDLFMYASV